MESLLTPRIHVVTPSCVEDSAFPLRANPRPRFRIHTLGKFAFATRFEDDAIDGVVFMMRVGFVPTFESLKAFHDFMFRLNDLCGKSLPAVRFELCTGQGDQLW